MRQRLLIFLVLMLGLSVKFWAQEVYNMPKQDGFQGTKEVNGTLTFYDYGGPNGSMGGYYTGYVLFKAANPGDVLRIVIDEPVKLDDTKTAIYIYEGDCSYTGWKKPIPEGWVAKLSNGDTVDYTANSGSLSFLCYSTATEYSDGWVATLTSEAPSEMTWKNVTANQSALTGLCFPGAENVDIMKIDVQTEGGLNPFDLSKLSFDLSGNAVNEFSNYRLCYGSATGETFGSAQLAGGILTFEGTRTLKSGSNIFYLVADVNDDAMPGHQLDATLTEVVAGGEFRLAAPISPDGERTIVSMLMMQDGNINYTVTSPVDFYDNGGPNGKPSPMFNGSVTFLPGEAGKKVQIDFTRLAMFNSYSLNDKLYVYNGSEANEESLLALIEKNDTPLKQYHSTAADGALTIKYECVTNYPEDGFEARVTLFSPTAMEFESTEVSAVTDATVMASAQKQGFAKVLINTINTEPVLNLTSMKWGVSEGCNVIAKAYLCADTEGSKVIATAEPAQVEDGYELDFNIPGFGLKEYVNDLYLLLDIATSASTDDAISLALKTMSLGASEVTVNSETITRKVLNQLIADVGVQDVSIMGNWKFANKPSATYYGYDNLNGEQVMIIRPGVDGSMVQVELDKLELYFSTYSTKNVIFRIINGAGTEGTVLYEATKNNQNEPIGKAYRSSDPTGAITILFNTNGQRGQRSTYGFLGTASLYMDNAMSFVDATATQASGLDMPPAGIEEEILRLQLTTQGTRNPLPLNEVKLDLKGCAGMVKTVKLISSGVNPDYVQPVVTIAASPAAETVTLRPEETFTLPEGNSYYWIAFDMNETLPEGQEVDAMITGLTIGGDERAVNNPDPDGSRTSRNMYIFHGGDNVTVDGLLHFYDNGGPDGFYNRDHSGVVTFRPANPEQALSMKFNYFIAGYNDRLLIYNGSETTEDNLLMTLFGDKAQTKDIISTAPDGSLTVDFRTGEYGLMLEGWDIDIEPVTPAPLSFAGANSESIAPSAFYPGSQENRMLHVTVNVDGQRGTLSLSKADFDLNGTDTSTISGMTLWASGTNSTFAGAVPCGEAQSTAQGYSFATSYPFTQPGTYHFWLTVDAAPGVEAGTRMSVKLSGLEVNGTPVEVADSQVATATAVSGLHGSFIIGPSDASDYKSFNQAVRSLADNGVDGPVSMLVEPGTYNETVNLQHIPGASMVNMVTIKSQTGNAEDVTIVTGEEDKPLSQGVINFFDGASYITLRDLTVTTIAKSCPGIIYLNGACKHNTIDRCVINGKRSAAYDERVILVYTTYMDEDDKNCNYFTLSNNRLNGGYYGLSVTGITNLNHPFMMHDVNIEGNTFVNQSCKALQAMGIADGLSVRNNRFENDGTVMTVTYHTMDLYRCTGSVEVSGNRVDLTAGPMIDSGSETMSSTADGIYVRDITNTRPSHKRIYNNDICVTGAENTNNGLYGIYIDDNAAGAQTMHLAHNTVLITGQGSRYSSPLMIDAPVPASSFSGNLLQNKVGGPALRVNEPAMLGDNIIVDNALFATDRNPVMVGESDETLDSFAARTAQPIGHVEEANFLGADMRELSEPGNMCTAQGVDFVVTDLSGAIRPGEDNTIGAYEYKNQSGTPSWIYATPRVEEVSKTSATLVLSADKASKVRIITRPASDPAPVRSDFDDVEEVNIHAAEMLRIPVMNLQKDTEYATYVRLTSYLGVELKDVMQMKYRTLSDNPVVSNPVASIVTKEQKVGNEGERITLVAEVKGGEAPYTYLWSDGSGQALSSELYMSAELTHSQTYRFSVIDSNGKTSFDELNVEVRGTQYVATFDDLSLPPESHWAGSLSNRPFLSGSFAFDNYNGANAGYSSWGNFTYANSTSTLYNSMADQYNSAAGSGVDGSANYGVAYMNTYTGATYITVTNNEEGDDVKGIWVTNTAWVLDAIRKGDGMSKDRAPFGEGDYYKLNITGLRDSHVVDSVVYYMADFRPSRAEDRYALDTWQWIDISKLGKVQKLWFRVDGTKRNFAGLTTPAYICIDNVGEGCPWIETPDQIIVVEDGERDATIDLLPLLEWDASAATISVSIISNDIPASLDSSNAGLLNLTLPQLSDDSERFTVEVKATQQGRAKYLRVPVVLSRKTGINDLRASKISIYPIPAHDVLHIDTELDDYSVVINDLQGRVASFADRQSGNVLMDVSHCAPGTYILTINHAGAKVVRKIIVR